MKYRIDIRTYRHGENLLPPKGYDNFILKVVMYTKKKKYQTWSLL